MPQTEHRPYKGPVDGTSVLRTPTPAPRAALPGTARTTSVSRDFLPEQGAGPEGCPAPRRQRTDLRDRGVRMPLRRRAPPRDWAAPRPRPAAPALPARATRRARRGSGGLPRGPRPSPSTVAAPLSGTGRCRVPVTGEGGTTEKECSVNRAFVPSMLLRPGWSPSARMLSPLRPRVSHGYSYAWNRKRSRRTRS